MADAHIDNRSLLTGMEDSGTLYRRRKWRFAGRVARKNDGRWSTQMLHWMPPTVAGRRPGRPLTRWTDDIVAMCGGDWTEHALDVELWRALEDGFVARSHYVADG